MQQDSKYSLYKKDFLSILYLYLITSVQREVKDSRRLGMYQRYHFLTRLGMQSL